jgi:hypothetical protein
MPRSDCASMMGELGRRGGGSRESGAFPLADRSGGRRTVTQVAYMDDLDPGCLAGGISFVNGLAYSRLWGICDAGQHHRGPYHQRRAPDVCQLRGAYFKVAGEPIIFWAALLH